MRLRPALLPLLLTLIALAVAGCGGGEETTASPDTVEGGTVATDTGAGGDETDTEGEMETQGSETDEEETETEGTETEGAETEGGETTGGGGGAKGDPAAGKTVFATAGCGGCHAFEAAGSSGSIGPDLDESSPDYELAVDRVTNGQDGMPSFKDQLSEKQISDVAAFVSQSAGS